MRDLSFPGMKPPAPALDEPLEMLAACHDRIEAQLRTLEKLPLHLVRHGADADAQEAAAAVMRYFDTAGQHHHCDEEEDLFPVLQQRSDAIAPTLDALLAQHREMENAWTALRMELAAIREGKAQLSMERVESYARLYREHIACENREVLPLAARVLTPDDIQTLSRAMTARRRI